MTNDYEIVRDVLAEFRAYAPDYFAEKWDDNDTLKEALKALDRIEDERDRYREALSFYAHRHDTISSVARTAVEDVEP